MTTTNGDFIDTNLFLNTNPNQHHQQQQAQTTESNGPIITTPSSPLDDASGKNGRTNSLTNMVQPTSTIQLSDANPSTTLNSIDDGSGSGEDLTSSQELMKRTLR